MEVIDYSKVELSVLKDMILGALSQVEASRIDHSIMPPMYLEELMAVGRMRLGARVDKIIGEVGEMINS